MAILTNSSRLLSRRNVILSGLFSFAMVIMYLSSSSSPKRNKREGVGIGSSLPLPQQYTNWGMQEPEEKNQYPENIPEGLQYTASEPGSLPRSKTPENTTTTDDGAITLAEPKPKKILIWNSYWKSKALWHKIFEEIVYKRCPQPNCELTTDRGELAESDAVLFHLIDIPTENYTFPESRDPNQIWIGMSYEPPYILNFARVDFKRLNGMFNRTMSYRTDGDIVVRHGTFSRLDHHRHPFPTYVSNWINSHQTTQQRNYAGGKRRLAAWFASSRNCQSQSGREKYVKELQNYVQVDIYGSCGPYKCGVQKTMRNPYKVEEDDCYMLVSIGYKFVLAFENSLCEDYVTEKLYNHLKLNVVPVVFGASNYSLFAPPHSVIDASQFSPEELADYLQLLDRNDTLYNQYFEWKKDYFVEAHDGVPLACDLCEQLHNPNWQVEKKVYDQFDRWITSGCRKGYGE